MFSEADTSAPVLADSAAPDPERSYTCVVDVDGLAPGSAYRVELVGSDGEPLLADDVPFGFRTDPVDDGRLRVGLISCHDPYRGTPAPKFLETWDKLGDLLAPEEGGPATYLLAGGDQVYSDADKHLSIPGLIKAGTVTIDTPELLAEYRELYHRHWSFPGVRRVHQTVPTYMIWDDHDVFDGWGSQRPEALDSLLGDRGAADGLYRAARRTFLDFQAARNPDIDDGRVDDAVDFVIDKGGVSVFVLDGRSRRGVASRTDILGAPQRQRFRDWLERMKADPPTAAMVLSAVPVVHLAAFATSQTKLAQLGGLDDDLFDEWDHPDHAEERDEWLRPLFEFAHDADVPVSILSGDVHVGAAFRLSSREFPGAVVYQLTSSAISQPGLPTALLANGVAPNGELAPALTNTFEVKFALLTPVIEGNNLAVLECEESDDGPRGVCTFYERTADGDVLEHSRLVLWGVESEWTEEIARRTDRIIDNEQREAATALLVAQFSPTTARWDRDSRAPGGGQHRSAGRSWSASPSRCSSWS